MDDIRLIECINLYKDELKDYKFIQEDDNYINNLSNIKEGTIIKYFDKKYLKMTTNNYVKLHPDYDLELFNTRKKWEVHIYANKHYIFYKCEDEDNESNQNCRVNNIYYRKNELKSVNELLNNKIDVNYTNINKSSKKNDLKDALLDMLNNNFKVKKKDNGSK
jgi:hypothetical protein